MLILILGFLFIVGYFTVFRKFFRKFRGDFEKYPFGSIGEFIVAIVGFLILLVDWGVRALVQHYF